MSKRIKMIHYVTIALLGFSLTACDNAIFSKSNSNGNPQALVDPNDPGNPGGPINENGDLVFLDDSFEREDLFGDVANNMIVGWRGAWEDHGTIGTGFTGDRIGMEIFTDQEMGPAADGERATYFYGRPGSSIHTLWLISPSYDLSNYNTVIMNYRYLTIALNDQEDIDANFIEAIRLQVCNTSANECGANSDFVDVNTIGDDSNWVTIAESSVNEDDDNYDGTNHLSSDFLIDLAVFDLNGVAPLNNSGDTFNGDKSEVVFRFEVDLRDGFANGNTSTNPDYDEHKCRKYTQKKERYCAKKEYKCNKFEEHRQQCVEDLKGLGLILSATRSHEEQGCDHFQSCKDALHWKGKCKHYTNKCEHYTKKMKKYCDKGEPNAGGTLVDGVILDLVNGIATERDISEIF